MHTGSVNLLRMYLTKRQIHDASISRLLMKVFLYLNFQASHIISSWTENLFLVRAHFNFLWTCILSQKGWCIVPLLRSTCNVVLYCTLAWAMSMQGALWISRIPRRYAVLVLSMTSSSIHGSGLAYPQAGQVSLSWSESYSLYKGAHSAREPILQGSLTGHCTLRSCHSPCNLLLALALLDWWQHEASCKTLLQRL